MAKAEKITVKLELGISEETVEKCLRVLELWLGDHPDKTIHVKDENGVRTCVVGEADDN